MTANSILLSAVHYPVTVLGDGQRLGLWVQGCTIGCKGCVSRDTWAFDRNKAADIVKLMAWVQETCGAAVDGVTISGGEPFDQPDALLALLKALRQWLASLTAQDGKQRDILCYSGYPWKRLRASHQDILALLDVVIPEPYIENRAVASLRGSNNQTIECLTDLGRDRYANNQPTMSQKRFQLLVDGDHVMWAIGIPEKKDMHRLTSTLKDEGIQIQESSWLA